ncbi:hypothetical protein [Serratia ureilytica]|uniref:hypothetical protein n=1 Tax=Serratia ureilytica TaxID=300181 RepID=UPI00191FE950|nr:hypothetical protein [Serratia ureilytica]MBL0878660.1 hypothetical protein [Serratia ureilytica]MDN2470921.1 hypothetical protein [Serratia ureilytica]
MSSDKKWYYVYALVSLLIIPLLYRSVGIFSYWYYEVPKELSLLILFVVVPVGTYVCVKKIILAIKFLLTTKSSGNGRKKQSE